MRAAPPVSLRCQGGRGWRSVQAALPALAAAAVALWALGWAETPQAPAAACTMLVGAVVGWLVWRAAVPPAVLLSWDGQSWTADGSAGALEVMIDLGAWLLLRLRPEAGGSARWIAVGAREAGPSLHALRAAVYSRPSDAAPRVSPTRAPD